MNDPFSPPPSTKWNVLNLGAGVQSSCLALMAAKGEVKPMPDFAVFADTQAEPSNVYEWLDWLKTQLPYPVITVTKGSLTEEVLKIRIKPVSIYSDKPMTYLRTSIPVFGLTPSGEKRAALGRSCTAEFKIRPILKEIRKRCGIVNGQKEISVTQWIGISYDEMQRMKLAGDPWTQHRWPLVEKRMTRSHCKEWLSQNKYPEPPRSACYYCPFHDNEEWARMKKEDPVHFEKAVVFDKTYRKLQDENPGGLRMRLFLHRSCKPLDEVDFSDKEKNQISFDFNSECNGMCGV